MKHIIFIFALLLYSVCCIAQGRSGKVDGLYTGEIGDFLPCVLTYKTGQSDVNQTHLKSLSDVAAFMNNHPKACIVIVGSQQGNDGNGQKIAQTRAVKAKNALINRYKISPSRLIANQHSFSGSILDLGLVKYFAGTSDAVVFYEKGFSVLDECMTEYEREANRQLMPLAGFMVGYMLGYDCPVCDGTGYVNGHKCDRCNNTGIDGKRSLSDGMSIASSVMGTSGRGSRNKKNSGNNGWQIKQYDEGIYEGHLVNGKRNGWGMIVYRSGQCYTGLWKNDKIALRGMLRKSPYRLSTTGRGMLCDREVGSIDNKGKMANDRAVLRWNGTTYVGNLKNGRFYGYGEITDNVGNTLKANFVDGKPGRGTCTHGINCVIEADFSDCDLNTETVDIASKIKGKVKYIYNDGGYYYGELKNGSPYGKGTITMPNGDVLEAWFTGAVTNALDESKPGVAKYRNGDIYVGYGGIRPEGRGMMLYAATHEYVKGTWKNGQLIEKEEAGRYTDQDLKLRNGTRKYNNGDYYIGKLIYTLPHGAGKYEYANGDTLLAKFEYGEPYGKVKLTLANGEKYFGQLKDGKMYDDKAIYTYPNGDEFFGSIENGKKMGKGIMRYHNKKYEYGVWKDDKLHVKKDEGKWKKNGDEYEYKSKSEKGPSFLQKAANFILK